MASPKSNIDALITVTYRFCPRCNREQRAQFITYANGVKVRRCLNCRSEIIINGSE